MQESFVEYRFSRFTRQPVRSQGELRYLGAEQLVRAVTQPRPETSTIGQGMIRIERPGQKVRQVSLKRVPELQALLASFTGLLGGDATRLTPLFTLSLTEATEGFTLRLTPRAAAMQKRISHIDVLGVGSTVSCLVFAEPDREQSIVLLGKKADSVSAGITDAAVLLERFEDDPHSYRGYLLPRKRHLKVRIILNDLLDRPLEVPFLYNSNLTISSSSLLSCSLLILSF